MPIDIPSRGASKYCNQYARVQDTQRLIQILTESGQIAMNSRIPKTAQSRYELAIEAHHQVLTLRLDGQVRQSIIESTEILVDRFPSQVCMNEALGLCDKANKVKTDKTQLKHLLKAKSILERGLARHDGAVLSAELQPGPCRPFGGHEALLHRRGGRVAPRT